MLYAVIAVALVILDQVVKVLVRTYIPLGTSVGFLPGIMDLTYVQNTGAAFSLFREHTWLLALISAVASVVLVVLLIRRVFSSTAANVLLSVVLSGAVGNLIDRLFLGYVTDMFKTTFMNFAVFNVADICLVCGIIALCVYVVFFESREKKEDGHDAADPEG
ncbi:MAG TPA: signal peptidase II [Candidatus Galloscillospira stercoripullorum]|nr:signal peptidase II [Candidatus Galloscillospira stercoripullorum]